MNLQKVGGPSPFVYASVCVVKTVSYNRDAQRKHMPIYEYQCKKCGTRLEAFLKLSDKQPTRCRKCGGRLEKLVSSSAIQFKGEGWYVTDYARKGSVAEKAEKEPSSTESASNDKPSADKDDKPSADKDKSKKPSAKKTDKT